MRRRAFGWAVAVGFALAGFPTVAAAQSQTGPKVRTVEPAYLFGFHHIGEESSAQTVSVRNEGDAVAILGRPAIAGSDFIFVETDGCQGVTLPPGAGCVLVVAFVPSTAGDRTATLQIPYTGGNAVATLLGTGSDATAALTPSTIQFGEVELGSTAAARRVTLAPVGGNSPLHVNGVAIAGPFSVDPGGCAPGRVLAPGQSCPLDVRFTPDLPGPLTGTLTVADDGPEGGRKVDLAGIGVTSFMFAEGTVRPEFVEFLTVQNPTGLAGTARVVFQAADDVGNAIPIPPLDLALRPRRASPGTSASTSVAGLPADPLADPSTSR